MKDRFIIFMFAYVRYHQYGEWRNLTYRQKKFEYKKNLKWGKSSKTCPECKRVIHNNKELTIDHIIPLWVCRDFNVPELEFDSRNFRLMCMKCNNKRGNLEENWEAVKLSPKIKLELERKKQIWENKKLTLFNN